MRHLFVSIVFVITIGLGCVAFAQNPICPPGLYIPNPTARVWEDGMLYVYGSRDDDNTKIWSSEDYWVMRTSDLVNWECFPEIFKSSDVSFNADTPGNLFAPDIMYRDGTYYLYFCQPKGHREGVATSDSPLGPFVNAKPLNVGKRNNQIDPAIFIDDDGQAYYSWGQFNAKIAKMKPSMTELDISTINRSVLTHEEHGFIEGNFMAKRKGIYYMVYAIHQKGEAPALAYATSQNPLGPYAYRGVLISNDGCDPTVRNNHGSIVEFKGQWYVFYHRATSGHRMRRKTCIEPITFLEDGSIPEIEMTSQGASGKPLNAFEKIEAERACRFSGNARAAPLSYNPNDLLSPENNNQISKINDKDWAEFKYLDFGEGAKSIELRVAPVKDPYTIHIVVDDPEGEVVGTVEVPGGGDGKTWLTVTGDVSVSDVHALYFTFSTIPKRGRNAQLLGIDFFAFK